MTSHPYYKLRSHYPLPSSHANLSGMSVAFVTTPLHAEHSMTDHPESPERLEALLALVRECGLLERIHRRIRIARLEPGRRDAGRRRGQVVAGGARAAHVSGR